jgi:hypothetical protein
MAQTEEWPLKEKRYLTEQRIIIKQADCLLVPCPSINDSNNLDVPQYHARDVVMYKPEVLKRLRDEVRKEQAAHREWLLHLVPLAIGLIGALSGFIAVWQRAGH